MFPFLRGFRCLQGVAKGTIAEIAHHLDLSPRSITDLQGRGILPRGKRGQLDADDCRRRYIQHLREAAAGRAGLNGDDDDLDLAQERAKLAKAQTEKTEMQNAVTRGELLPRGDVHRTVTGIFTRVRDRLTALPATLFRHDLEARGRLASAIDDVLVELAETRVLPEATDAG